MDRIKLNFRLVTAAIMVWVGSGLLIAGFTVPPLGVIDNSVLVAFGETSTFVGAILGIDYSYKYHMTKNKKEDKTEEETKDQ